ncbi:MAG: redox-sensing transcriptional repressor Rex [Clostridiales bacterium]|nr:redox-sensing transcriptional repressor Rex [Clostridiales bacterium]
MPRPVLERMPRYLNYLRGKQKEGLTRISSTVIAADLGLNPVQVRKDLAYVNDSGKPRTGFDLNGLVDDIEHFLGYLNAKDAILVGVGNLGQALLNYSGFAEHGLNILAAFDANDRLVGHRINGKTVYPMSTLVHLTRELNAHIGIITVPASQAQQVCDLLVQGGVAGIWNFAPAHLEVPPHVIVQNEDIAASLALLSNRLMEQSARQSEREPQPGG